MHPALIQSLSISAPPRTSTRSPRFHVQARQNPHRIQHHRGTDAIVRGSRRVMPRVVMASQHDNLVLLVRTGNFSYRVISSPPLGILFAPLMRNVTGVPSPRNREIRP